MTHTEYTHAVGVYLTNCRADSMSPCTISNYAAHLTAYGDFCFSRGLSPDETEAAAAWKLSLHDGGAKNSTVAVYLRDVRVFFRWACASPLTAISNFPGIDALIPPVKRRPYEKLMTEDQIVSTLAGEKLAEYRRSPMWARNSAMAVLLLESAVRISELCALVPEDLDWERGIILIRHGKGDKLRYVAFPPLAQRAVRDYLESGLRPDGLGDLAPLFGTTSKANPEWHALTRTLASDLINRHIKAVTGRDDVRAHALRHASASAMLMEGFAKEDIQQLLGHSSLQTTERYIGLLRPEDAALRSAQKFSNLERRTVREVS